MHHRADRRGHLLRRRDRPRRVQPQHPGLRLDRPADLAGVHVRLPGRGPESEALMPLLINFKDAVNASILDQTASHAVFYMDGDFENEAAVRAQCPHAKLYAITVRGATGHGIFACDSETGDLDIPQTEAWTAAQVALNVSPIVDYANQDRWLNLGLLAALAHYGERIERWDADYDGSAVIPSWASAKQ